MSKFVKGLLIGAAAGAAVTGVFIPFGDKKISLFERLTKKETV